MDRIENPATPSVEIRCAHDAVVPLNELRPNPRNPNKHPPEQIRLLAKLIQTHGWRGAIAVSNRSGMIVRGHARHRAAMIAGLAEAPVDYQDYETEEEEYGDMIADNRIAELSEVNGDLARDIVAELRERGVKDLETTGYGMAEVEAMLRKPVELPEPDGPPPAETEEEPPPHEPEALRAIVVFQADDEATEFFKRFGLDRDPDRIVYNWSELARPNGDGT